MSLSKCQPKTYAWCYTGPEGDTATVFNWTVDNFLSRCEEGEPELLFSENFKVNEETFCPRLNTINSLDTIR